ncbi:molluscan insulin-related peptide 3-like [Mytilus trossulus]|uniref:molluscan insulin-related peptide 3-like n=1 Tax=Mytilus trossulus TaxID=6551 RepID=UPI003006111A
MRRTKAERPKCCRKKMSISGLWSYVLFVILMPISPTLAGLDKTCTSEARDHQHGLCGRGLSETLQLICMGQYNIPVPGKRDVDEDQYPRVSRLQGIILGKREAFSYLSKRSSAIRFQGIICECCYNQCGYDELLQYCSFRKKRDLPHK